MSPLGNVTSSAPDRNGKGNNQKRARQASLFIFLLILSVPYRHPIVERGRPEVQECAGRGFKRLIDTWDAAPEAWSPWAAASSDFVPAMPSLATCLRSRIVVAAEAGAHGFRTGGRATSGGRTTANHEGKVILTMV
jgi:hypothetical protein